MMFQVGLVALGGAIGASLRYLSGVAALRLVGSAFPWGTLFANVLGSLLMGLLFAWFAKRTGGATTELRLFFATGVLGGFTTFSAFSLDALTLIERGALSAAAGYISASVILSITAIFIGLWFGRAFL